MWPGQQPPGGEQNPQDQNQPNPYQQPGYQQPNPYQQPTYPQQPGQPPQPPQPGHQPGYGQPNPYQQPTVPQYAVPAPPSSGPGRNGDRKTTTIVAIAAALVVLAAAGVTGYLVLGDDDKGTTAQGGSEPSQSASASDPASTDPSPSAVDNPRNGSGAAQPTIPGWKVVYNPKRGALFDIPPDWEVVGSGVSTGFEDEKAGDGSPVVTMSAPGRYKSEWCTYDADKNGTPETWSLATAGTKGGQGAKDTAEAASIAAGNWVWAGYAQTEPKEKVKVTKAVPYETKSGLKGHIATATALNTKHENKCDTDGKSIAFAFKNTAGDFVIWVLYANTGIPDEVPNDKIQQILSTVRLAGDAS